LHYPVALKEAASVCWLPIDEHDTEEK
jgi:hypothetical protein